MRYRKIDVRFCEQESIDVRYSRSECRGDIGGTAMK
jgi:hypothetical protein